MDFNSIKVTTPDPTKYHPGSGYGTTIPRSAAEGQSRGFDPNVPTPVIVDPGMPDGGFVLDVAALSKNPQAFNMAASREGVIGDVTSFYRNAEDHHKFPVFTMAPPARETLNYVEEESAVLDSDLGRQVAQQAVLLNKLAEAMVLSESRHQQLSGFSPAGVLPQVDLKPSGVEPKGDLGFVSLQIPFLTGVKPERPQYETYFEMPKLGTMSARYHVVVPGRDCLALIYDTRFEDGFQYLPPNLGEELITVSVPRLKKAYQCSSLGLHWTLGCLDVVMLLMHKEEVQ